VQALPTNEHAAAVSASPSRWSIYARCTEPDHGAAIAMATSAAASAAPVTVQLPGEAQPGRRRNRARQAEPDPKHGRDRRRRAGVCSPWARSGGPWLVIRSGTARMWHRVRRVDDGPAGLADKIHAHQAYPVKAGAYVPTSLVSNMPWKGQPKGTAAKDSHPDRSVQVGVSARCPGVAHPEGQVRAVSRVTPRAGPAGDGAAAASCLPGVGRQGPDRP